MAYVKVSKLAREVVIERCGNGYVVRPEYSGVGYDEKNEHNEVHTTLEAALKQAGVMLAKGLQTIEEQWVEDKPARY